MDEEYRPFTIEIDVFERHLWAMSQVLKRMGYEDVKRLSEHEGEAYEALYAFEQVRKSLAKQGYNPR